MSIQPLVRKIFVSALCLFPSLFILSCSPRKTWHSSTFVYFDTICELRLFCLSSEYASAQQEVQRTFSAIESLFSPGSRDLSSPEVVHLYRRALDVYHNSEGCFDITVGPLTKVWGFLEKSYHIPKKEELDRALTYVGMDKIKENNGVLALEARMELDWGGVAKGFGIDMLYQRLVSSGIERGYINAGGDLRCWGENPDNETWKVGIKHPRKTGYLGILSISDLAAATTGDYQRFFEKDGVRYHHVFDPRTGYPARGKQSVTVIGPETLICDALSTALFVCDRPEDVLKKYPQYGAIIVDSLGKIQVLGKSYPFHLI